MGEEGVVHGRVGGEVAVRGPEVGVGGVQHDEVDRVAAVGVVGMWG